MREKLETALPCRSCSRLSICISRTFRLHPFSKAAWAYQSRTAGSLTFSRRRTVWNHGICAAACGTKKAPSSACGRGAGVRCSAPRRGAWRLRRPDRAFTPGPNARSKRPVQTPGPNAGPPARSKRRSPRPAGARGPVSLLPRLHPAARGREAIGPRTCQRGLCRARATAAI